MIAPSYKGTNVVYYLSFITLYTILFFFGAFQLFIYEDRWDGSSPYPFYSWASMQTLEKVGACAFYGTQFPFGLLLGLIIGSYGNFLIACLINPMAVGWTLKRIE